ncbi:hypothetical protein AVEN_174811-1 [Araneus ventricosus]|uniref:Uncharacterized protein n=1 Tax=Araneus ventricosus TaxID=182803 RepID=A0A4Y2P1R4_ARAVE|nr:hypothetical protein AVEN_174811-1 [Araneus ventricosus]
MAGAVDSETNNKLHAVKPLVEPWPSFKNRKANTLIIRLCIGHTRFTHLHLLRGTTIVLVTSMTRILKFTPERSVVVESLHAGVKKGRNECAERLSTQKRDFPL